MSAPVSPTPLLEPETRGKGWLCGYDDKQHPLHQDFIRRSYPEGGATELACRCLPGMQCRSHRNSRVQQAEVEQHHQRRLQTHLAKDDERKYQFFWYNDFKMLPPDERHDHTMPWHQGWDHIFDCLDLAAKEVLYHFYAYCIVFSDRTIGNFLVTSNYYMKMMLKLRHNAIGPSMQNKAFRRACCLELFMQNNPRWFDQTPGGQKVIREVQEEVSTWQDEDPKKYGSFVRPWCANCWRIINNTSEVWVGALK